MRKVLHLFVLVLFFYLCAFGVTAVFASPQAVVTSQVSRDDKIDIEYPVVSGLDNLAAEEKINTVVLNHIKRFSAVMAADSHVREAVSRYEVHHNADGLLSLTITQYQYSGGAHGMSVMKGFTFDLLTGYVYQFTDLLPPWERDRFNQSILQQIAVKKIPLLQPFTEIKAEPDFYLLPERKLVIFYQLYELAPYAWGFVRFPIDY